MMKEREERKHMKKFVLNIVRSRPMKETVFSTSFSRESIFLNFGFRELGRTCTVQRSWTFVCFTETRKG
jgi:hypothetical protein